MQHLKRLWHQAVGRHFRRIDFIVVCRDLETPDPPVPARAFLPFANPEDEFMVPTDLEGTKLLDGNEHLCENKISELRRYAADPKMTLFLGYNDDQDVIGHLVHAKSGMRDPLYSFQLPIQEGRDIIQFDGWVAPVHRGKLIGALGLSEGALLARRDGFKRSYSAIRVRDGASLRLHAKFGFVEVGQIRSYRFGPLRYNRYNWVEGGHPSESKVPAASSECELGESQTPGYNSEPFLDSSVGRAADC